MDYQTKPQFVELPWRECCTADCSRCPTFSSPFRRVGDVAYCRFALLSFRQVGDGLRFNPDRIVRLVFVLSGSLKFERANDPVRLITSKQCACLPCGEPFSLTGQDEGTRAVVLSLSRGLGFCEGDIFGASASEDTVIPADPIPSLSLHPVIESLLAGLFVVPELVECARYPDQGDRTVPVDQGALHSYRAGLFLSAHDAARRSFPHVRLQQLRTGAQCCRTGCPGWNEPFSLQTPLCRTFRRQRLPLDDAAEGAADSDRYPGWRAEYACPDGKVRFPLLHAVQPFLQELSAGNPRPTDCRVASPLMLRVGLAQLLSALYI